VRSSADNWALLLDLLIFAIVPQPLGLLGALMIVAAAALVAFADRIGPWLGRVVRPAA
jgi:drug/metabolite transporter (DMT)-like permease